jgi:ribosome-associated translation inhibitor RaiA
MRFSFVRGRATLPERFEEHVLTRLGFAFDRFRPRLLAVAVHVDDLNGPRGGRDKFCRVRVRVRGHGEIVAEDRSPDLVAALDRAVRRAQFAVSRAVERLRFHPHAPRSPGKWWRSST